MAAAAAKERRRDKCDDTMYGADLMAAVKFVHLKKSMKGWSSFSTTKKRVHFLGTLSLPRTELVICDFPGRGGAESGRRGLLTCAKRPFPVGPCFFHPGFKLTATLLPLTSYGQGTQISADHAH